MGLFEAIILGIVQGLTEFLPISSSGHLVLLPAVLGWTSPPLVFDTTVHLATLIAVLAVFWRDVLKILTGWVRGLINRQPLETTESRLGWWIILGTIPGILTGLFLEEQIEFLFTSHTAAGIFLLVTALILILAELLGRRQKGLSEITWRDSLLIGIGQACAIAPGLSRSGTTIFAGMLTGLNRETAARFSFILSIPIITGAGLVQFFNLIDEGNLLAEAPVLLAGFATAAISGYIAIRLFLNYLRKRPLYPFAVYCVVVGILTLILI